MGLLNSGLELQAAIEAEPPESMPETPGMGDELRSPMTLWERAAVK